MKLIDLLVQELPKRGGWPEGAECSTVIEYRMGGDLLMEFIFPSMGDRNLQGKPYQIIINNAGYIERIAFNHTITKEQYESALSVSQKAACNGEGLPPVGMHCKIVDPDGVLMYGQDESGEVIAHVENTAVIRMSYGLGCFEARYLRPARSEADNKRQVAAQALCDSCGGVGKVDEKLGFGVMWLDVYDAIASGKIPGVKLED